MPSALGAGIRDAGKSPTAGLRYSEEFADPVKLLATVNKMGLEGVVSKRADAPYRSGTQRDWVKVKARTWREAKEGQSGPLVDASGLLFFPPVGLRHAHLATDRRWISPLPLRRHCSQRAVELLDIGRVAGMQDHQHVLGPRHGDIE